MSNLDAIINEVGFEISQIIDENMINKMLGVLANDGVYAMWVFCLDKLDWKFEKNEEKFKSYQLYKFMEQLNKLSKNLNNSKLNLINSNFSEIFSLTNEISKLQEEIKKIKDKNKKEIEKKKKEKKRDTILNSFFWKLSEDIHQLLFFKEMVEKALIYARYHAKALGD